MELTENMIDGIIHRHLEKPTHDELMDACRGKGGEIRSRSTVRRAFVYDLMCDVIVKGRSRSINDVFKNEDELRKVFGILSVRFKKVTNAVDKWLTCGGDEFEFGRKMYMHLMDGVRMFSSTFDCAMPSDFPYERCRELIRKYNTNGVMYDPSCGWGSRLSACIAEGVQYIGTDPNDKLCPRLVAMGNAMNEALGSHVSFDIFCRGSQHTLNQLNGKCGLILTSPPYFDLEDYRYGEQSISTHNNYEEWLSGYLYDTMLNCKNYLTDNGNCIINVKNFGKCHLYDDMIKVAESVGLHVKATEPLKNIQRFTCNDKHLLNNDETCVVFGK